MNVMLNSALRQYQQAGVQSEILEADPHRLVHLLMAGALDRMAVAKGNMERGEIADKGRNTGAAIAIIDGLRASLDMEKGGEIARNLEALYDYMMRRLLEANCRNEVAMLDEVASLLMSLKSAWDAIPDKLRKAATEAGS